LYKKGEIERIKRTRKLFNRHL